MSMVLLGPVLCVEKGLSWITCRAFQWRSLSAMPPVSKGPELILFDLDGVLLDSKQNMELAWSEVQRSLGVDMPFSAYFALIGRPFRDIMGVLGLEARASEIERVYRITSQRQINAAVWYDGAVDMLLTCVERGIKIGIVTSKDVARTRAVLALLPVDFTTIQTPANGLRGKPAPDHLMVACAEANTDPGNCVYVGDMIFDYQAACRAGIRYIHAAWGYGELPAPDCPAVAYIDHLLPALFPEALS